MGAAACSHEQHTEVLESSFGVIICLTLGNGDITAHASQGGLKINENPWQAKIFHGDELQLSCNM